MMRFGFAVLAVATVAACSPKVPDSAAGVGFGDYERYQSAREAELQGTQPEATVQLPADSAAAAATPGAPLSALNPSATAPIIDSQPLPTTAEANPAAPAAQETDAAPIKRRSSSSISDEQDFSAVSSRETIQSDRQRLEQQREQYQVIAPTALPERNTAAAPNIVQFALTTTNNVGEKLYNRSGSKSGALRNCTRHASPDLAQEAFLAAGGPRKDSKNLDPDGDGFACHWDPAPFRLARQ